MRTAAGQCVLLPYYCPAHPAACNVLSFLQPPLEECQAERDAAITTLAATLASQGVELVSVPGVCQRKCAARKAAAAPPQEDGWPLLLGGHVRSVRGRVASGPLTGFPAVACSSHVFD